MIDTVTKIYLDGEFIAYKITYTGSNIEVSVGEDLNNRHYQEILEWVENGGVIVDNGA